MPTLNKKTLVEWMSEAMHPDSKLTATVAFDRVARHLFGQKGSTEVYHAAREKLKARLYPKRRRRWPRNANFTLKAGETKQVTFMPPKED